VGDLPLPPWGDSIVILKIENSAAGPHQGPPGAATYYSGPWGDSRLMIMIKMYPLRRGIGSTGGSAAHRPAGI